MGPEAGAPALPLSLSYLARAGERVLIHKHDVPRDLEMGDLGRENQPLRSLLGLPKPGQDPQLALNLSAFICTSPAAAGCTGRELRTGRPTFPLQKALTSSSVHFCPALTRMQAQTSSPIRESFTPTTCLGQMDGVTRRDIPLLLRGTCAGPGPEP